MSVDIVTIALLASLVIAVVFLIILLRELSQRRHVNKQQRILQNLVSSLSDNLTGLTLAQATKMNDALEHLKAQNPDLYLMLDALGSGMVEREEVRRTLGQLQHESANMSHGFDFSSLALSVLLTGLSSFVGFVATFLLSDTSASNAARATETNNQLQQLLASLHAFIPIVHTSIGVLFVVALGLAVATMLLGLFTLAIYSFITIFIRSDDLSSIRKVQRIIALVSVSFFSLAFAIIGVSLAFGWISL